MKGRKSGQMIGPNYSEVRYADFVAEPSQTRERIGRFIDHTLDHDRILRVGIGSVSRPNTSIGPGQEKAEFNPVGCWKKLLTPGELRELESLTGNLLADLGYPFIKPPVGFSMGWLNVKLTWATHGLRFEVKHWVKTRTRLNEVFGTVRCPCLPFVKAYGDHSGRSAAAFY